MLGYSYKKDSNVITACSLIRYVFGLNERLRHSRGMIALGNGREETGVQYLGQNFQEVIEFKLSWPHTYLCVRSIDRTNIS